MRVTTSRFTAALATLITAVATFVVARYFADDPTTAAVIGAVATVIAGLFVPAAAAPVGTVDAGQQRK